MKIILLCGGVGKRMFPMTEDKFLLNFMGRTLLEHQIEMAQDAGLKDFVIIGNPGNIQQIKHITTSIKGAKFEFALQMMPLGIADALKNAAPFFSGEILIVNPDDVFDATAYKILLDAYANHDAAAYMLGYEVNQYFPGGYLAIDEKGNLTRIVEKPEPGTEPSNLVNILLHLHSDTRRLLEYIDGVQTTKDDVYELALDNMVRNGHKIKVTPYTGFWAPIKYPWHIFNVIKAFLDGGQGNIAHTVSVSDRATVSGKVIICENVRILENAVVKGPVYIGPNTVIGTNALIREYSHIGANCVIGFSTEIKSSYIGDACWFHSSYIGDSIIGNNCSFGAGTVTANFRFDEEAIHVKYSGQIVSTGKDHFGAIIGNNCKTGINSSILPGWRIGPNSVVGSHVCLATDLEPDTMIFNQAGYQFIKNENELDAAKKQNFKNKR